ncbi:hypothetical protein [Streptomyces sp. PT12]|uniref:hypothetical protein n=1 Tax=Streptomyces sp. PT12 TaxID=1510197 RepID=UPI000DE4EC2F|nr:hypothetical protein [Streptomyces sp. PT12]RBM20832.1 hypothetical protein DEH69_07715 [Streptomyces sp. PT12]
MARDGDAAHATLVAFRAACHEAAARVPGVTFYELTEAAGPTAYHSAAMSERRLRHRVVCRPRGGLVAFAAPPPFPGSARLHFREPPRWAETFTLKGLRVLDAGTLGKPLSAVDLGALEGVDEADRAAARRWRPGTLGELLFNWWERPGSQAARAGRQGR